MGGWIVRIIGRQIVSLTRIEIVLRWWLERRGHSDTASRAAPAWSGLSHSDSPTSASANVAGGCRIVGFD